MMAGTGGRGGGGGGGVVLRKKKGKGGGRGGGVWCGAGSGEGKVIESAHPDAVARRRRAERRRERGRREEECTAAMMQIATSATAVAEGGAAAAAAAVRMGSDAAVAALTRPDVVLENWREAMDVRALVSELRSVSSGLSNVDLAGDTREHGNGEHANELLGGLSRPAMLVFHAPWCRACRAFGHKLRRIAEKRPRLLVINIDVSQVENVVDALGVRALPYVQFYDAPTGKVFGGTTGSARPERMNELSSAIAHFDVPKCDLAMPKIPDALVAALVQQQQDEEAQSDDELFPFNTYPPLTTGASRCR